MSWSLSLRKPERLSSDARAEVRRVLELDGSAISLGAVPHAPNAMPEPGAHRLPGRKHRTPRREIGGSRASAFRPRSEIGGS